MFVWPDQPSDGGRELWKYSGTITCCVVGSTTRLFEASHVRVTPHPTTAVESMGGVKANNAVNHTRDPTVSGSSSDIISRAPSEIDGSSSKALPLP